MVLLIYSPFFSNRLEYVLNYIFEERLGLRYELCADLQEFLGSDLPKLAYTAEDSASFDLQIHADRLLFSTGISIVQPRVKTEEAQFYCFCNEDSFLGFDVFAAIFFFISRYEEYLPFKKDVHGRFEAEASFAYRYQVISEPLVDQWINLLRNKLSGHFPQFSFKPEQFEIQPSFDIDQCFAFKEKGNMRIFSNLFRAVKSGNWKLFRTILAVRYGSLHDPFDVYEKIKSLHLQWKIKPIFFILFSEKLAKYDKNISIRSGLFQKVIKGLVAHFPVGIHPSYHSRSSSRVIESEIHQLNLVSNVAIDSSRQHYLKLRLPNTYKALISIGIEHEYSMGFASMIGFRAGTSRSFRFYDLKHEQITFLRVHPFSVMDTTLQAYLKLSPADAKVHIQQLIDRLVKVNGLFMPLWHNESMSDFEEWKGWANLYEEVMQYAISKKQVSQ